jgi:hypothetical protein
MYRRVVLGVLGAAALVLAGLGGPATRGDDKDAGKAPHAHGMHAKCARACAECMLHCESCFHHCGHLALEGKKEHAHTAVTCNDCGEICAAAAKIVGRGGLMSVTICESCAKACDMCGEACEKMPDDEHMKACAKSCRECATACREMIKHAGHQEEAEPKKP